MDNVAGSCLVAQIDLHRFLPLCAALCQRRCNACGGDGKVVYGGGIFRWSRVSFNGLSG
jgi:hypothetical protein